MSAEEWQIVWFTAWVSALSTVIILPFGLGVAWLLARYDWPGKSVVVAPPFGGCAAVLACRCVREKGCCTKVQPETAS